MDLTPAEEIPNFAGDYRNGAATSSFRSVPHEDTGAGGHCFQGYPDPGPCFIVRAEFVEDLEGRLPEAALADLMHADVIALAKRAEQVVHLVVKVSCTADADELARAVRRRTALASSGCTAIGIVARGSISPQTLDATRNYGLRVRTNGWLLPKAA